MKKDFVNMFLRVPRTVAVVPPKQSKRSMQKNVYKTSFTNCRNRLWISSSVLAPFSAMSDSATVENPPAPDAAADIVAEMNDTAATNATGTKIPATPEGMAVAYGSLVIMALIPG